MNIGNIFQQKIVSQTNGYTFKQQVGASYPTQHGDSGSPLLIYEENYGSSSKYTLYGLNTGKDTTSGWALYSTYGNIVKELQTTCITE